MPASVRKRLTAMLEFTETVDRSFGEIMRLPAPTLMGLIRMGGAIARFAGRKSEQEAAARDAVGMNGGNVPCPPLRSASRAEMPAPEHPPAPLGPAAVGDLRFRTLVGEAAWAELPEAVRRRFSKCLAPDETLIYRGNVSSRPELSRAGRVLSFLARAIGSPLPLTDGATGPALVVVTEDPAPRRAELAAHLHPPRPLPAGDQLDQALPRRDGPRGVRGLRDRHVAARHGRRRACSSSARPAYFLELGRWRLPLPRAIASRPHADRAPRRGRRAASPSRLQLTHPLLGRLVHQLAIFRDA